MLYAILCYNSEDVVCTWSKEEDEAVMARLDGVLRKYETKGKIGPVARLLPTSAATTLRKSASPMVIDGPFAETKEQFLGFYVVDCVDLDEALAIARELSEANAGPGSYEIRPIGYMREPALKTPQAASP